MLAVWAQVKYTAMLWDLFGVGLSLIVPLHGAAIFRELFPLSVR